MSDMDPEIEIVGTEVGPPWRFRELVALALKTTDPKVLDAAELDYRGVYDGVDAFVRGQAAAGVRGAGDPAVDDRGGGGALRGVRVAARAGSSALVLMVGTGAGRDLQPAAAPALARRGPPPRWLPDRVPVPAWRAPALCHSSLVLHKAI